MLDFTILTLAAIGLISIVTAVAFLALAAKNARDVERRNRTMASRTLQRYGDMHTLELEWYAKHGDHTAAAELNRRNRVYGS